MFLDLFRPLNLAVSFSLPGLGIVAKARAPNLFIEMSNFTQMSKYYESQPRKVNIISDNLNVRTQGFDSLMNHMVKALMTPKL